MKTKQSGMEQSIKLLFQKELFLKHSDKKKPTINIINDDPKVAKRKNSQLEVY